MSLIGNISLNLSWIIYLVWLAPQVLLNFNRKNTMGLSLSMHGILCIGYLCDLMYGFGRGMPWQYRMVTITGLFSLAIQHYQIHRYGLCHRTEKSIYIVLHFIYSAVLIISIYVIYFSHLDQSILDLIGMCANTCWLTYSVPQIIKNYNNQSTIGLSTLFICFSLFINLCDTTSAWTLNWDYPNKVGPLLSIVQNVILIYQVYYYAKTHRKIGELVVNS
jgi:uncharacterized protein with PQ loop repeat